jgi:hypothetical protein
MRSNSLIGGKQTKKRFVIVPNRGINLGVTRWCLGGSNRADIQQRGIRWKGIVSGSSQSEKKLKRKERTESIFRILVVVDLFPRCLENKTRRHRIYVQELAES